MSAERAAGEAPALGRSGIYLGDAIAFFLDAKRAGGRGEKTLDDYRKKLDLFQRWLALRADPEEVDALYAFADALEAPTPSTSGTSAASPTPPERTTSRSSRASSRPRAGG